MSGDTKDSQRKYLSGLSSGAQMVRKGMTGVGPTAPEFPVGLEKDGGMGNHKDRPMVHGEPTHKNRKTKG